MAGTVWFREPPGADPTFARRNEGAVRWLDRSTLPLARDCRRFLNSNLSRLPRKYANELYARLREGGQHWRSAFFEMMVARTLQALGAEVEVEPEIRGSHRPDFKASFATGSVIVEATAPEFNRAAAAELGRKSALTAIIEEEAPSGWSVFIDEIPDLGPAESKRKFKRLVKKLLDVPPPSEGVESRHVCGRFDNHRVQLTLIPFDDPATKIAGGPGTFWWGDSIGTVREAIRRKRRQVRDASLPVILAINASEIFSSWRDIDEALIGHRHAVYSVKSDKIVDDRFVEDGIFDSHKETPPTFAGALVYIEAGFFCAREPVLYLHPRFEGELPEELHRVERRVLVPGEKVGSLPPVGEPVLAALNPVRQDPLDL